MNQAITFLPMLAILGVFMFFASRRQKRAMQATIKRITDDTVDLEIATGVVTTWAKLAIRDRIEPEILDTGADEVDDLADDPGRLPND
jgi:preprotein translocase subunit YajC